MNKADLLKIKKILFESDNVTIVTTNKKTNVEGSAAFLNKQDMIRVYEGAEDGSDDKDLTLDEFLENYYFELLVEFDDEE